MAKPMFSYLGSKYRLAPKYGAPRYNTVVEPFAGSAAYSLYWEPKRVILCDLNPVISSIWHYLIAAKEEDILKLPDNFTHIKELDLPLGAKNLIGFWLGKGKSSPGLSRSLWGRQYFGSGDCKVWGEPVRQRIASQLYKIRHWEIVEGEYRNCPNVIAHWFIDPPYIIKGKQYPYNQIDYSILAKWILARRGFIQVCENNGAEWLPFRNFHQARGQTVKLRNQIYPLIKISEEALYERYNK